MKASPKMKHASLQTDALPEGEEDDVTPIPAVNKRKKSKERGTSISATETLIRPAGRLPRSREVREEDEARILLIEQEIEEARDVKTPTSRYDNTVKKLRRVCYNNVLLFCRSSKEGNDEAGEKPKRMVSQGTSTDELVVIPKKKTSVEQTKMLARRYQNSPKS